MRHRRFARWRRGRRSLGQGSGLARRLGIAQRFYDLSVADLHQVDTTDGVARAEMEAPAYDGPVSADDGLLQLELRQRIRRQGLPECEAGVLSLVTRAIWRRLNRFHHARFADEAV